MKIVVCSSMAFAKEMLALQQTLEALGHTVILPRGTDNYADPTKGPQLLAETTQSKIKHDLISRYYKIIEGADAILVLNLDKKGIPGYIGGNTFLEMAFAHLLQKQIFIYNPLPDVSYRAEIDSFAKMTVINGDLAKIQA